MKGHKKFQAHPRIHLSEGQIVVVVESGQPFSVRTEYVGRPVRSPTDTGAVVWSASGHAIRPVRTRSRIAVPSACAAGAQRDSVDLALQDRAGGEGSGREQAGAMAAQRALRFDPPGVT